MRLTAFTLTLLAVAGAAFAHGEMAGQPGDVKLPVRVVHVMATEGDGHMSFAPGSLQVARGEQVRFEISNAGALAHEFVIGTKAANAEHAKMMAEMPDMKHHDANAVTIPAGKSASLTWRFTSAGVFEFACLIPGHYEAGMHGAVTVK